MSTELKKYFEIDNAQSRVYVTSLKKIAASSPTRSKMLAKENPAPNDKHSSLNNIFSRIWPKKRSSAIIVDDPLAGSKTQLQRTIITDSNDHEVFYCKESEAADVISALKKIAIRHICKKEYHLALRSLNRALTLQQKALGVNHPDVATTYNLMGVVMSDMGEDYKFMALTALEESLRICQEYFGPGSEETARSLKSIWVLLHKSRKDQLARTSRRRSRVIVRRAA